MADPLLSLSIGGLEDMQRGLADAQRSLRRELSKENKAVAEPIARKGASNARGGSPQQRHFAGAIRAASTPKFARVVITAVPQSLRGAIGAFTGSVKFKQFPPHVAAGEMPRAVGPAVEEAMPRVEEQYATATERALRGAFPQGMTRGRF